MTTYAYYPGCSAESTGRELDESTRLLLAHLGIEIEELEGWTCCGASSAHAVDPALGKAMSSENLALAASRKLNVLTPCSACYARLAEAAAQTSVQSGPSDTFRPDVHHLLHLLDMPEHRSAFSDPEWGDLSGLRVVSYYGCLTSRPMANVDDRAEENPQAMDRALSALGATAIDWSYKTTCCGGFLSMTKSAASKRMSAEIFEQAAACGADLIVSACPMCQTNLERAYVAHHAETNAWPPVVTIGELLLLGREPERVAHMLRRHISPAARALKARGLL